MNFILSEEKLKSYGFSDGDIEKLKQNDANISCFSIGPAEVKNVIEAEYNLPSAAAKKLFDDYLKDIDDEYHYDPSDISWESIDKDILYDLKASDKFSELAKEYKKLASEIEY